jgi:DNA-binding IclR family transcriptional regulator
MRAKIDRKTRTKAGKTSKAGSKAGGGTLERLPREAGRIAVVDRAAQLLIGLAQSSEPVTLNEAADYAGLSKATAFRILATMVDQDMVEQDSETASYRLGIAPLRLATAVLDGIEVHAAARPAMRSVCELLNETVVLSVRDGDFRVNIEAAECTNAIGSSRRIGEPRPLHAGAASHVLLAAMADEEIEAYLKRQKAAGGPAWREQLWKDIARTRRTGVSSVIAETSPDSPAVATAIKGPDGAVVAALYVAIPRGRFSARVEERCGHALLRAAAEIGRGLADRG